MNRVTNKSNKLIFYFGCALLIASCNFIEDTLPWTKVEGKVIDYHSSKPIANANVTIIEAITYSYNKSSLDTLAILTTNEGGEYSYKFHAKSFENSSDEKYVKCWFVISKPSDCYLDGGTDITRGKKNYFINRVGSHGYVTIHIKNQNPFDNNDEICVCASTINGGPDCTHPNPPNYCRYGINVDENFTNNQYTIFGNNYQKIKWWVTKNGIMNVFTDSIFIKPCINNLFIINY